MKIERSPTPITRSSKSDAGPRKSAFSWNYHIPVGRIQSLSNATGPADLPVVLQELLITELTVRREICVEKSLFESNISVAKCCFNQPIKKQYWKSAYLQSVYYF